MEYRELDQAEYDRKLRLVIVGAEGLHAQAQNIGDGRATIGWGYTLNRNNNVEIWRASGIELTQEQWRTLAAVDAAGRDDKTRIGLTFTRRLDEADSDRLLRASMAEYEGPANSLGMPRSEEKIALVSLAYNRGPNNLTGIPASNVPEHPVMGAIRDGDRAEAWFQMRYNCWGSDRLDQQYPDERSNEAGLRKRRFAEAHVFGLYDDPSSVSADEAKSVYRTFQLHRGEIDRVEREFGVTADGDAARRNRIAQANRDYPQLVGEYGAVPTIADALAPARTALLQDLRGQYPDMADRLTDANFNTASIYLDPGRELLDGAVVERDHPGNNRTQTAVRREQRNSTDDDIDDNHANTLDSRRMRGNAEIESHDLLIGMGGGDTLRAHRGNDILIGGEGRDRMEGGEGRDTYVVGDGDTVMDSDGQGEARWGGRVLTGGSRADTDPPGTYRSDDGRYTYQLDGGNLTVIDNTAGDAAQRERIVIEGFQSGQLGIRLMEAASQGPDRVQDDHDQMPPNIPQREGAMRLDDSAHPRHAMYATLLGVVQERDRTLERAPDEFSRQLAGGLTEKACERGLSTIGYAAFSADGKTVGMTDTSDPSAPWARTAAGTAAELAGKPLAESSENVSRIDQRLALEQAAVLQVPTQDSIRQDDFASKGPRLS